MVVLIPLGIYLYLRVLPSSILIVMIYLAIPIGALFSDLDMTFARKYHRHWLFHSILFTGICWVLCLQYPEFMLFVAILNFSVGLHLLFDINVKKSKRVGFYCIKLYSKYNFSKKKWEIKGLNGTKSTLWFFLNFLASLLILGFTIVYFF